MSKAPQAYCKGGRKEPLLRVPEWVCGADAAVLGVWKEAHVQRLSVSSFIPLWALGNPQRRTLIPH